MDPTRAPHLLMTSCEIIQMFNYECKGILGGLFKTLTQKKPVKIISTTQSENDTFKFQQDIAKETISNRFVTKDGQLTWSDLNTSSQKNYLKLQ